MLLLLLLLQRIDYSFLRFYRKFSVCKIDDNDVNSSMICCWQWSQQSRVFICRRWFCHTYSILCNGILPKRMLKWNMKWVVEGSCTNIEESFSLWIQATDTSTTTLSGTHTHTHTATCDGWPQKMANGFHCIFAPATTTTTNNYGTFPTSNAKYELKRKPNGSKRKPEACETSTIRRKIAAKRFNVNVLFIFYNFIYTYGWNEKLQGTQALARIHKL